MRKRRYGYLMSCDNFVMIQVYDLNTNSINLTYNAMHGVSCEKAPTPKFLQSRYLYDTPLFISLFCHVCCVAELDSWNYPDDDHLCFICARNPINRIQRTKKAFLKCKKAIIRFLRYVVVSVCLCTSDSVFVNCRRHRSNNPRPAPHDLVPLEDHQQIAGFGSPHSAIESSNHSPAPY